MLGFKSFQNAKKVLAGIELIHKLKKVQYGVPVRFGMFSRDIWCHVLAAKSPSCNRAQLGHVLDGTGERADACPSLPSHSALYVIRVPYRQPAPVERALRSPMLGLC